MKFRTLLSRSKTWLVLMILLLTSQGALAESGQADVQLQTDLTHMTIVVNQGAPLPPGGCVGGYAWHSVYGGCRRAEAQSETAGCPAGYVGAQTRYRTAYILQANPGDIAYDDWGGWQSNCQPARVSGVVRELLGQTFGGSMTDIGSGTEMFPNFQPHTGWRGTFAGTYFAAVIDRPSGTFQCVFSWSVTSGGGDGGSPPETVATLLFPAGKSIDTGNGHCLLSNGGRTVEIQGMCDDTNGGDASSCVPRTRTLNVIAEDACSVTVDMPLDDFGHRVSQAYSLCD